jgi:hypothetical protein
MGSSSSKVARTAASTARRQYPSTSSIPTNSTPTSSPRTTNAPPSSDAPSPAQVHPDPSQSPPSSTKSQQIDLDGRDPQFGSRLSQIGPVQPVSQSPSNQHQFPPSASPNRQGQNIFPSTSATNPAVLVVQARERIGKLWEEESESLGKGSFQGRTLINAGQIREVLSMRESGMQSGDIERRLRLRAGLVKRLGVGSVVENA